MNLIKLQWKQVKIYYVLADTNHLQQLRSIRVVIKSRGAGDFPRLLREWPPATFIGK